MHLSSGFGHSSVQTIPTWPRQRFRWWEPHRSYVRYIRHNRRWDIKIRARWGTGARSADSRSPMGRLYPPFGQFPRRPSMNELVPSKTLERLEQRQEELIGELDALNARLEHTLNSFARPAQPSAPGEACTTASRAPAETPARAPRIETRGHAYFHEQSLGHRTRAIR